MQRICEEEPVCALVEGELQAMPLADCFCLIAPFVCEQIRTWGNTAAFVDLDIFD
ncbi:hypothetical protein HZA56_22975 [Candidatus Poribacteria bacterium]|nr:hypothetical protein [Candidatus Poribacteria bacterium]